MSATDHTTMEHAGERLTLDAGAWAHWERGRTLFVADTHFGKTAAFRAGGVPVPERTTARDLERLSGALALTGAQRLVILGDFLHAKTGRTEPVQHAIDAWRTRHNDLEILLVRGNHDRSAGDPPARWEMGVVDPGYALGPFTLLHEPGDDPDAHDFDNAMAGHLHPAVRLEDPGTRSRVRLPCFWKRRDALVLPGFGSFTGTHVVRPRAGDDVRVCTGDAVYAVRASASLSAFRPRRAGRAPRG